MVFALQASRFQRILCGGKHDAARNDSIVFSVKLQSVQLAFKQAVIHHMAYYVLLPVSAISVIDTIAVSGGSVQCWLVVLLQVDAARGTVHCHSATGTGRCTALSPSCLFKLL
jgi:hypothetical protein